MWTCRAGRVQASEVEVRAALRRAGAIEVEGRWHAVPPELAHHALRVLLLTCATRGWPRSAVPAAAAASAMEEDDVDPRRGGGSLTAEPAGRACGVRHACPSAFLPRCRVAVMQEHEAVLHAEHDLELNCRILRPQQSCWTLRENDTHAQRNAA